MCGGGESLDRPRRGSSNRGSPRRGTTCDDILVPTEGSEGVQRAIYPASLADAALHGLFVVDTTDAAALPEAQWITLEEGLGAAGKRAIADVEARAGRQDVGVLTAVGRCSPHEEIVVYADGNDVDLMVMGTHGRCGLDRVLLGSVTENVVREAETPVPARRIEDAD